MKNIIKVEEELNKNVKSYLCKGKYINDNSSEIIYDVKFREKNNDKGEK